MPIPVPWIALFGFMTETEAVEYVKRQGMLLTDAEFAEVREKAKAARDYVAALPERSGLRPQVSPSPPASSAHLESIRKEPTFQEHLAGATQSEFAMVEVGKLVAFQAFLNCEYLESLAKRVPPLDDNDGLLRFCLPLRSDKVGESLLANVNPDTSTYSASTDNLDYRIIGNVQGEDPASGRKFAGFAYGPGLREMSVAEYNGRYILKNGYHRALALRKADHRFIPVLVVKVPTYNLTGANRPGFFPSDVVMGPKPAIIDDFSTPAAVAIKRLKLKMVVSVHAEVQAIPV